MDWLWPSVWLLWSRFTHWCFPNIQLLLYNLYFRILDRIIMHAIRMFIYWRSIHLILRWWYSHRVCGWFLVWLVSGHSRCYIVCVSSCVKVEIRQYCCCSRVCTATTYYSFTPKTATPIVAPTCVPTARPTTVPTYSPTHSPTYCPTRLPTYSPTYSPT